MKALQQAIVRALGIRLSASNDTRECGKAKNSNDCCWIWPMYHDL